MGGEVADTTEKVAGWRIPIDGAVRQDAPRAVFDPQ
jgi:hypothetical protein